MALSVHSWHSIRLLENQVNSRPRHPISCLFCNISVIEPPMQTTGPPRSDAGVEIGVLIGKCGYVAIKISNIHIIKFSNFQNFKISKVRKVGCKHVPTISQTFKHNDSQMSKDNIFPGCS